MKAQGMRTFLGAEVVTISESSPCSEDSGLSNGLCRERRDL